MISLLDTDVSVVPVMSYLDLLSSCLRTETTAGRHADPGQGRTYGGEAMDMSPLL